MIKVIIIPAMSLVETFVRFYMISSAEKKTVAIGSNPQLQMLTASVRENLKHIKVD